MNKNVARIARAVVLKAAESKKKTVDLGKYELYHNSFSVVYQLNYSTIMPAKGDHDDQRNGDSIIARGWKIRCLVGNKADRPNLTYRFTVVSRAESAQPTYGEVYANVTGNVLLDAIDNDRNTKLFDKRFKPNPGIIGTSVTGGREYTTTFSFWIPRKKLYNFTGNDVTNDRKIWLIVMAYDAYGSLVTDNPGYVQIWTEFIYKDP